MKEALKILIKKNLRETFPNRWALIGSVITYVMLLLTYWYTARAFGGSFGEYIKGQDYFTYVIWGEILLVIPFAVSTGMVGVVQTSLWNGTWETFLLSSAKPEVPFLLSVCASSVKDLIQVTVLLGLSILFFHVAIPLKGLALVLLVEALSLPTFIGLGFMASAFFLVLGRGSSMINQIMGLISLFAGVMFPITVFPLAVQKLSTRISPFTFILEASRQALSDRPVPLGETLAVLVTWGIICFTLGRWFFLKSVEWNRSHATWRVA